MSGLSYNLVFCLAILLGALDQPPTDYHFNSSYSSSRLQLSWNSPEWTSAACISIKGSEQNSENVLTVRSSWNADTLYFYFKVQDQCLRANQVEQDHPRLYLDDMVEVLIDPRMDRDTCWAEDDLVYHINIWGIKKDDRGSIECMTDPSWDGSAEIWVETLGTINDTLDRDSGYLVTLGVPWEELDQNPIPGLEMGINFANGDNDGKGRQLFDWVTAWPMRSPHQFGTILLTEK